MEGIETNIVLCSFEEFVTFRKCLEEIMTSKGYVTYADVYKLTTVEGTPIPDEYEKYGWTNFCGFNITNYVSTSGDRESVVINLPNLMALENNI